jgi:putative acetyltransferase
VASLVVATRATAGFVTDLSLVADLADDPVVGHIMISVTHLLELATDRSIPILMLSPLGVRPDRQNRGVGSALTTAAIEIARDRAEPLIVVQGHPDYYPRFDFERGRPLGIEPPVKLGAIDKAWMVLRMPAWVSGLRGRVVYPPVFEAIS